MGIVEKDRLPDWHDCMMAAKTGIAETPLSKFIYENEPAGNVQARKFREGLQAIVDDLPNHL